MACLHTILVLTLGASALRLQPPAGWLRRYASVSRKERGVPVFNPTQPEPPMWDGQQKLRVVIWNIQYGAGIAQHYFYDGGPAVSAESEEVVRSNTLAIGDALAALEPDVVLLQEVDRRSRRTYRVDEMELIASRLPGLQARCSAAYWRVPYVPSPKQEHIGRVGMHLAVLSRYKLGRATRTQLSLLDEKWYRKFFNLRRCLLDVQVGVSGEVAELTGGAPLHLLNTHLSAFSGGDGTLEKQVGVLLERTAALDASKRPWLLAGDFNSLPPVLPGMPKDTYTKHLRQEEAALYPDAAKTPIAPLYASRNPVVTAAEHASEPQRWWTYKPYVESSPDRAIDHAFTSSNLVATAVHVAVPPNGKYLSDHQPLVLDLELIKNE